MTIFKLSWRNIVGSPLNTILSLLLMSLGVGIISLLILLNNEMKQQVKNNLKEIDMVVGAKGSPLQLILSSVYHIDNPTGNIPLSSINKLKKNRMVDLVIPLSYGDSYEGFRIVGSTHDYIDLYNAEIKEGRRWEGVFEVVVGSEVAKTRNLQIGDNFYGSHGLLKGGHVHNNYSYNVVGILTFSGTVIDKLILTDYQSVWDVHNKDDHSHVHDDGTICDHDHESEMQITAALFKFKNPSALIKLPRQVNETTNLQAAVPVFEMNRLINLLGIGFNSIQFIAVIIMIVSGLSIFISLYNSLKRRRYELALLRVHGASRWQLVQLIQLEALFLSVIGAISGLFLSRLSIFIISNLVSENNTLNNFPLMLVLEEFWLLPSALLIGIFAALIPTLQAYRTNIPKLLIDA